MEKKIQIPSEAREIASSLLEIVDEVQGWEERTADVETAVLVKSDGGFTLVYPDQRTENIGNVHVQDAITYVKSKGFYIPDEVAQVLIRGRRAIVPVAPMRRLRKGGPVLPAIPRTLEEPARTFAEIEIYRRLLARRWRDRYNRFNIQILRHSKPLKNIADLHAKFFTAPEDGDIAEFQVSLNAVALALLARLDINTDVDFAYDKITVDFTGSGMSGTTPLITFEEGAKSLFGDGSVSLDLAVEYLVGSLANGRLSVKDVLETPIVNIPLAPMRRKFAMIESERSFVNTSVSGSTHTNVIGYRIYYDISPTFLSFDLLGYVKATGLEEHAVVFTPGQPFTVELQDAKFVNADAQNVLANYFIGGDKTVPGLFTVEFIALVFGA